MDSTFSTALLTGAFGLGGVLAGVVLNNRLGRRTDERRLDADDARRWLADRRLIYSNYLSLSEQMLRRVDAVGVFLSYDGNNEITDEDELIIAEGLSEYLAAWEDELQPALHEVQLMASPEVSDLADRVSGALMEVTTTIETRGNFT